MYIFILACFVVTALASMTGEVWKCMHVHLISVGHAYV